MDGIYYDKESKNVVYFQEDENNIIIRNYFDDTPVYTMRKENFEKIFPDEFKKLQDWE